VPNTPVLSAALTPSPQGISSAPENIPNAQVSHVRNLDFFMSDEFINSMIQKGDALAARYTSDEFIDALINKEKKRKEKQAQFNNQEIFTCADITVRNRDLMLLCFVITEWLLDWYLYKEIKTIVSSHIIFYAQELLQAQQEQEARANTLSSKDTNTHTSPRAPDKNAHDTHSNTRTPQAPAPQGPKTIPDPLTQKKHRDLLALFYTHQKELYIKLAPRIALHSCALGILERLRYYWLLYPGWEWSLGKNILERMSELFSHNTHTPDYSQTNHDSATKEQTQDHARESQNLYSFIEGKTLAGLIIPSLHATILDHAHGLLKSYELIPAWTDTLWFSVSRFCLLDILTVRITLAQVFNYLTHEIITSEKLTQERITHAHAQELQNTQEPQDIYPQEHQASLVLIKTLETFFQDTLTFPSWMNLKQKKLIWVKTGIEVLLLTPALYRMIRWIFYITHQQENKT
jgi:hypothetical protein